MPSGPLDAKSTALDGFPPLFGVRSINLNMETDCYKKGFSFTISFVNRKLYTNFHWEFDRLHEQRIFLKGDSEILQVWRLIREKSDLKIEFEDVLSCEIWRTNFWKPRSSYRHPRFKNTIILLSINCELRSTVGSKFGVYYYLLIKGKMEKNNSNSRDRSQASTNNNTTTTSSSASDFVLQWGNRKRLRCMKVQQQQQTKDKESAASGTPPVGQRSITTRVDRRVVRSPNHQNKETVTTNAVSNGNGYINLRQRSSSPAHRVLRNSESSIGMKGQGNGGRGVCSPDRGGGVQDKRSTHNTNANANHHHNGKNNNNGGGSGGGGSGSSETALDMKKGGTSPGSEAVPIVWPPKFVIGLTNKEKEEDFLAIKGSKLPQRPKKRAKFIQRTINLVSPGGWLCDLTLERYEVREKKITKKRPRGLKAMGSMTMESESE
ncbi:unnamed protein product [Lactuca virosa]|uniref:DUF4283 domain-containing protein n=1 Tax=Lactuca virosa TaxID=75947 RepID=A0AAU9N456_9ASTR|nr:unnamed protein product [Lactuca virosa]